ncbi:MAG TPA: hypothetical protein VIT91_15900 [Chthoniobacterales bacterium]
MNFFENFYHITSPDIQCNADKVGAKVWDIPVCGRTVKVLAHTREDAASATVEIAERIRQDLMEDDARKELEELEASEQMDLV